MRYKHYLRYFFYQRGQDVKRSIARNVAYSEHQMVTMGVLGFIGFPIFYIVWTFIYPQPYESLALRAIGSIMCLFLMLRNHWPSRLRQYLPVYWYVTALYTLPFFFGFYVLKNAWSEVSVMTMLCVVFLLILLVDWLTMHVMFILGTLLALLVYWITSPKGSSLHIYFEYLLIYSFAIIAGSIFNFKTAILQQEKLTAMAIISGSIAHELRTPLLGIKSGSLGIKRYLPVLFEAYNMAMAHGLPVTPIRAAHYNALISALERIESETNNANTIIDILLMNVGKQVIDSSLFDVCTINGCVNEALKRYPFSSTHERDSIHWEPAAKDYSFRGTQLLMVHVIFNLLKNALHYLAKAGKGEIFINVIDDDTHFYFSFKDTGVGIPLEIQHRIFERFFSTTIAGSGIGLPFCRLVIESFGGTIACLSKYQAYTEFRIRLPKLSHQTELASQESEPQSAP